MTQGEDDPRQSLFHPRATKPTHATIRCVKITDDVELSLDNRNDDQLCNSFKRFDGKSRLTAIPCGQHQLTLIIRINETNQITQYDAVFVTQAAAWQNECRVVGIIQMNGHACWDEYGLAWL